MASDAVVETTIKLPDSSEAHLGDLVNHRMIITNGDTNGQVIDPTLGPTVLEMSCSAENATENSIDRQKYESRQREYKEEESDGAVVKHKNYEETAVRSRVQTADDAEVSSSSTVKFEEHEKVREKDGGAKLAEYNATCEETHQTSVSTVEKIGDREFTRTRSSQKSLKRTCRRIEDMEDNQDSSNGQAITETSECNESSQSSGIEQGDTDDVIIKRSEKTTKSEHSSTTVTGKGDPSVFDKYEEMLSSNKSKGALLDLGALGEIKLSTQVASGENTLERDFKKPEYFNPDLVGLDFGCGTTSEQKEEKKDDIVNGADKEITETKSASLYNGSSSTGVQEHAQESTSSTSSRQIYSSNSSSSQMRASVVQGKTRREQQQSVMAEQNGHVDRHVGEEEDDEPRSLPSSFTTRHRWIEDDDYEPHSLPPPFAPKNRQETDDLIKRILAEAKGITSTPSSSRMNGTTSTSSTASTSSTSESTATKTKYKINMGGDKEQYEESNNASSVSEASATKQEESQSIKSVQSESTTMQKESASIANESINMESSKVVGAERKRLTREEEDEEQMSLFERRLAKGVEKKLANIFTGDEERMADGEGRHSVESDRSRSSYASERSRGSHSMMDTSNKYASGGALAGAYGGYEDLHSKYGRKIESEDYSDIQSKYSRKAFSSELDDIQNKYSRKEKDEFDEIDDEINTWRTKFREQQQKRMMAYMGEEDDSTANTGVLTRYQGRGRLVRQGYTESEENFGYPSRGPPPPDYIPDEEFEPKRRAETEEIVTEKTAEIRTVVDKQSSVLEKLRSASNSFDELTNEIRSLKQQLIENTARRSFLMDDEMEDDDDPSAPPAPPRGGRFNRYASGSQSFDFSTYTPGSYSSYRQNRLADLDREFSDNITGQSLGLARYKKTSTEDTLYSSSRFANDANSYSSSRFAKDDNSYSSSRFANRGAARFGRSQSMYDESTGLDDDQKSEGDEFEEYRPRPRPLPNQEPEEDHYTPSVGPGYGSGHSAGDPDLGRSYKPRFTSSDDSSTRFNYTSRFSSGSGITSGYKSRLSRANTLSDFDFDRPTSQYGSSSSSGFTSRFLSKVRENRAKNPEDGEDAPKRDKPFKSRFLRQSFDSNDYVSKSSSYISRLKSSSTVSAESSSVTSKDTTASDNAINDTSKDTQSEE